MKSFELVLFEFPREAPFASGLVSCWVIMAGILFGLVLHMMVWAVLMMVQIANEWSSLDRSVDVNLINYASSGLLC